MLILKVKKKVTSYIIKLFFISISPYFVGMPAEYALSLLDEVRDGLLHTLLQHREGLVECILQRLVFRTWTL